MKVSYFPAKFVVPFLLAIASVASGAEPMPAKIKSQIDQALELRNKQYIQHYNPDQQTGKAFDDFELLILEIGKSPDLEKIEGGLPSREGVNLETKIALWAVDKKRRPELYKRVLDQYLNDHLSPPPSDPFAPKSDQEVKAPEPVEVIGAKGLEAPKISPADLKEELRLPLEYAYFIPPKQRPFSASGRKKHIAGALAQIGSNKSIILLRTNVILADDVARLPDDQWRAERDDSEIPALIDFGTAAAFDCLADVWQKDGNRDKIKSAFTTLFQGDTIGAGHDRRMKLQTDWRVLSQSSYEGAARRNFANWLNAIIVALSKR